MSHFVEVKTAELTGNSLRWAVGKAEGLDVRSTGNTVWVRGKVPHTDKNDDYYDPLCWGQGGPLIDKYKPWISPPVNDPDPEQPYGWDAEIYDEAGFDVIGRAIGCPSNLIAICRAIVAAKLGDVVQVPAALEGEVK